MKNKIKQLFCLAFLIAPAGFLSGFTVPSHTPAAGRETVAGGAYVIFAGKYGGEITRKEIESHSEVKVDGCAAGSKIFQFTLSITKGGQTTMLTGQSGVLTGEMLNRLKNLSKGDSFEFQNTKARLPNDGDVVNVHGKKFVVV